MHPELAQLCELDQQISESFQLSEINAEEILRLVDKREQLLQNVFLLLESNPDVKQSSEWYNAVSRTRKLVELMQSETNRVGQALKKYRHGNKSIQQYQKFL